MNKEIRRIPRLPEGSREGDNVKELPPENIELLPMRESGIANLEAMKAAEAERNQAKALAADPDRLQRMAESAAQLAALRDVARRQLTQPRATEQRSTQRPAQQGVWAWVKGIFSQGE